MLIEDMDQKTFDWRLWHRNVYQHDAAQRDYYNEVNWYPGKFEGTRRAVESAYEVSLNGCQHDDFGSVEEYGYYCRVLFDEAPHIVCFRECGQGFIYELTNNEYEMCFLDYVEQSEENTDD